MTFSIRSITRPAMKLTMAIAFILSLLVTISASSTTITAQEDPDTHEGHNHEGDTHEGDIQGMALYTDIYGHEAPHVCELPYIPNTNPNQRTQSEGIDPTELARLPQTATFTVNYTGNWTSQAKTAFEHALAIWSTKVTSSVPIVVNANWSNLGSGVLGAAGPANYIINFSGAPKTNTWYPVALANALAGTDLSASPDISASFNSTFDWYYGTDGNPPNSQIDFISVVLHEVGHGLGFTGSFQVDGNTAAWGSGTTAPDVFDPFVENEGGGQLITFNSSDLRAALTSNAVFFDGTQTRAANGGSRARLYAPTAWSGGSSIAHLDEIYNGTSNALMTFSIGAGVAEHDPGDITLGMFADMGWTVAGGSPIFNNGAHMLEASDAPSNVIDLWAYATDSDADSALTFEITSISGSGATITLNSGRYLNINPTGTGTLTVSVKVTDSNGNTATATFTIYSVDQIYPVYLPLISK